MTQNNKKKSSSSSKSINLKEMVMDLLSADRKKTYSIKQIIKKLGVRDKKSKEGVESLLYKMENEQSIQRLRNGSFRLAASSEIMTGVVDYVNPRFAYVVSEQSEEDIRIEARDLKYAFDGDTVEVRVFSSGRSGRKPEGEVINVIQRKRTDFVGRLELSARYAFVVPDFKKMHFDIFIKLEDLKNAKHNDKVIVKITQWPDKDKNPEGKIVEVLGPAGENETEIHSIMAEFGLPFRFTERLEKEANKISEDISAEEISKRRDFRDILTFTIDPEDAKDFDDALSLRKLDNGNYEVGVHIADVTHYVTQGGLLDQEALERATSVYLVDRTIPMLPEKLSNDLCSLRPNEDKLTFAAVFELDSNASIKNEWFGKTIIHSARRFSYEEAQERIESKTGDLADELILLNNLALKLRDERFRKGAVNFETVEVKFKLDEKGKPLGIIPKVRKDAHKLIEEFMLLANKRVAEFVYTMKKGKTKNTFVYRTHDFPDPDKLKAFSVFAKKFGHELKMDEERAIASSLNNLIEEIEGKPEQNVLQSLAIRTMAKAKYTTEPDPHFGLAFRHYSHFTSPIRRYPDMMAHRLLFHYLNQGKPADTNEYEDMCVHSSEMEKRAADAERASIKYKQVEYMQGMEDRVFEGIVSGVTEWGVFVEITETRCEGMVRMADLTDDYYEFDEENYRIIGKKNKKMITLGDDVKVRVKATDIDRRTIDLVFAEQ